MDDQIALDIEAKISDMERASSTIARPRPPRLRLRLSGRQWQLMVTIGVESGVLREPKPREDGADLNVWGNKILHQSLERHRLAYDGYSPPEVMTMATGQARSYSRRLLNEQREK